MPRRDDPFAQAESLAVAIGRIAAEARNEEELRLNFELVLRPVVDGFHLKSDCSSLFTRTTPS
jgi:hypothetical protein